MSQDQAREFWRLFWTAVVACAAVFTIVYKLTVAPLQEADRANAAHLSRIDSELVTIGKHLERLDAAK